MGTSMTDCGPEARTLLARLATPCRNLYFYGKLLDEYHLELEQRYGNTKRWLINRLTLGSGILCGLDVVASSDNSRVRVTSGVAIDGLGREIIVPQPSAPVDPTQATDDCGRPEGQPIRGDERVTLAICYHECEAEPTPVMISECGPEQSCENGLVCERYRLRIIRGLPAPPGFITPEQCSRIFAEPPQGVSRRQVICETLSIDCAPPDEVCVPLAVITLNGRGGIANIQRCAFRRTVYSNAVLLDLILCLASRVDECCGGITVRAIMIVSGNNQSGTVGEPLAQPLVVRVVDGGNPVANEPVTFEVVPNNGLVGGALNALATSFTTNTDASGIAVCPIWQLGPTPGPQGVTARIAAGTPSLVTFSARAARAVVDLPVVRALWPTSSVVLSQASPDPIVRQWFTTFMASPRFEITFNHKMLQAQLGKPDPWLRVFALRRTGDNRIDVLKMPITYAGPAAVPILGQPGFTEVYAFGQASPPPGSVATGETVSTIRASAGASGVAAAIASLAAPSLATAVALPPELRLLVLMRAESGNIVDTSTPTALLLDAEFAGTRLTSVQRDQIWPVTTATPLPQAVWDALVDTGARLPQSGDNVEGGQFHGWFSIVLRQG
jgi:hypothetical protein